MSADLPVEATQPDVQPTRPRWICRWESGRDQSARWTFDATLIIMARGLRSFAYGLLAVVLGVWVLSGGLSLAAIGVLITVSLAGDFCSTCAVGVFADRWGRRRTLAVLAVLMAATGVVF